MEVLTGASKVKIGRGNFSNIGGDQNNYYYMIDKARSGKRKISKDPLELSRFTEIKHGDIYKDKDVCHTTNGNNDATEAAVYYAEININGPFGQKKFTVKTYRGRNARKEWKRDFLRCSMDWCGDVPLFGYNTSSVPLLIFCGELVPLAHIEGRLGHVGGFYVGLLRSSLECAANELWIDPIRGKFRRGPAGPQCSERYSDYAPVAIPTDVEFLKEEVVFRYFGKLKDDQWFLAALSLGGDLERTEDIPATNYPHIVSGSTNQMIAFTQNLRWWSDSGGCIDDGQVMPDGAVRFRLRDEDNLRYIEANSIAERSAWLSQALGVFHVHNISLSDNDLSNHRFIYPFFKLTGTLQRSRRKQRRRQRCHTPIYLFFLPSPFAPSARFHLWSFDPNGEIPLSSDMCKYLGLPFELFLKVDYYQRSWPTEIYKIIHDYQIARGFDPKTTEFLQYLKWPVFKILPAGNSCKFQEIEQEKDETFSMLDESLLPALNHASEDAEGKQLPPATNGISCTYRLSFL
ncbi:hypothetical protein E1B28_003575 [Marasmius oreades]|uniref:Uncharacterized protein n=1 Tax=Marasmius oreades TaxID=181124 RepID=A0A9P7RM84_9AGAR|nr:uncharacterized protein E1B28_003575 [Marasmius oreades]KAG7086055.1 hypothetical protein E1B28_003575 [Marasmius oreades]